MFNRHIQVKMVKNEKTIPETTVEEVTLIRFAQANKMMKDLIHTIGIGVVGYVVVDTLRQVVIAQATKPR